MTMYNMSLIPDSSSYAVTEGTEVISTILDGGAANYLHDKFGSTSLADVTFVLTEEQYAYIRAFYRTVTVNGSIPFTVQMILDNPYLDTYTANFVPGSLKLSQQQGLAYWVVAQFELQQLPVDDALNLNYVDFYNLVGPGVLGFEDLIDQILNSQIPGIPLP